MIYRRAAIGLAIAAAVAVTASFLWLRSSSSQRKRRAQYEAVAVVGGPGKRLLRGPEHSKAVAHCTGRCAWSSCAEARGGGEPAAAPGLPGGVWRWHRRRVSAALRRCVRGRRCKQTDACLCVCWAA